MAVQQQHWRPIATMADLDRRTVDIYPLINEVLEHYSRPLRCGGAGVRGMSPDECKSNDRAARW